jgi:hypothetical protein
MVRGLVEALEMGWAGKPSITEAGLQESNMIPRHDLTVVKANSLNNGVWTFSMAPDHIF